MNFVKILCPKPSSGRGMGEGLLPISFLCNLFQRFAAGVGGTDETDDERDNEETNHAVGCDGEAFAVLSVDKREDQSPQR